MVGTVVYEIGKVPAGHLQSMILCCAMETCLAGGEGFLEEVIFQLR